MGMVHGKLMPVKNTIIPHSFALDAADFPGTALTIGNFDGVHCGHAHLLTRLKKTADERGLACGVMSFTPHPREYFALQNQRPELIPTRISTLRDKICALRHFGADFVALSHFNKALAHTSPEDYVEKILLEKLKVRYLLVGRDFRFGHKRGGDIFLQIRRPRLVGIFAGLSPFSHRLAVEIDPQWGPVGVCTSSGTVGPSYSAGRADAALVLAPSAALADAAASAVGNVVQTLEDVERGVEVARSIKGVSGVVVIKEDRLAVWGKIKLVPLKS